MSRKFLSIVIVILAGLYGGCRNELIFNSNSLASFLEIGSPAPADTTPPTVTSWAPTGAGISTGTAVTVQFSEAMNTGTVTSATFLVDSGAAVSGTVSYASGNYVFTPASPLANGTTYTATVTTGVTDLAGNPLAADFTWTFTTVTAGTVPAPALNPIGGTYDAAQSVDITCSQTTASIYYTLDGSTPTTSSTQYTGTTIAVDVNTTVSAIAVEAGYDDSAVTAEDYYIRSDQPTLNYATGSYTYDISVEIYPPSSDPSASLYYTLDGSTPTTSSAEYTGTSIDISGDPVTVTVTAIAVSSGKAESNPVAAAYTIDYDQLGAPTMSPSAGTYDDPQSVYLYASPTAASIYYTTDGSDPTAYGTLYDNTAITVSASMTIRAYATYTGYYTDSPEASAAYIINPDIAYINPNSGHISETGLSVLIRGERFDSSASVALQYGASSISPTTTSWIDSTSITCVFDLTGASSTGYWSVAVTNPDGGAATLVDGFRIYDDPAGIVSWWKLDGNYGDSGTAGNNGTSDSDPVVDTDRFGNANSCYSSDDNTDYIKSTADSLPVSNSPRTIMGWFRLDSLAAIDQYLFGYEKWGTSQHSMLYVQTGTNLLTFNDSIDSITITGRTALTTGRWYHAAVTYDGTTVTLYLDGMVEGTAAIAFNTDIDRFYMFMGEYDPSIYLDGALDDVMVLDTALTQAEVKEAAAYGGYLLPPTGLNPSKGTYTSQVVVSWDPVVDATDYIVYRSTALAGTYSLIASGVTGVSYTDDTITPDTTYYYKVAARNESMASDRTKAEVGWGGSWITYTDNFETATYASWWDSAPTVVGDTYFAVDGIGNYSGSYGFHVYASTCTSGCGFAQTIRMTKSFSPGIPWFSFSMWYMRMTVGEGEVRLYVNNTNPSDETGLVPFDQEQNAAGWNQLTATYIGDVNDVTSITLVFYDVTQNTLFYADDIQVYTVGW